MLRVKIHTVIEGMLANQLWEIYNEAFSPLNLASPCRQSLNYEEFCGVLRDKEVIKAVLLENEDTPLGISLGTCNLSKVPWVSPDFFRQRFPVEFQQGQIYYFLGTAVAPKVRRGRGGVILLSELKKLLRGPVIAAYDYVEGIEHGMDRFGQMICRGEQSEILGKQVYWAGRIARD